MQNRGAKMCTVSGYIDTCCAQRWIAQEESSNQMYSASYEFMAGVQCLFSSLHITPKYIVEFQRYWKRWQRQSIDPQPHVPAVPVRYSISFTARI